MRYLKISFFHETQITGKHLNRIEKTRFYRESDLFGVDGKAIFPSERNLTVLAI